VGNRLTDDKTSGNWTYDQNNELQGFDDTTFEYNLNGQMTEKTVAGVRTTYRYNLDGRLSEIRDNNNQVVAQYQYDPFGRRTSKHLAQTGETIYFHYSKEGLVAEYDSSGNLIQSYGYKPDSLFTTNPVYTHRPDFTAQAKGGYVYYINDHLATPQKLITETGYKVWEAHSDAYGKTIITNNEFRNPLRFPGQYTDDESNLRYNYFRYYDPQLGRYITSDPIGLDGGLNTYGYVFGNPVKHVDPRGLVSSWSERFAAWRQVGWDNAWQASDDADTAETAAKDLVNNSDWYFSERDLAGGPLDSYRHCVWSCLMRQSIGREDAKKIGDLHEDYSENPSCTDRFNNGIGRDLGALADDCLDDCLFSLPYLRDERNFNLPIDPYFWIH
jgi:RHS repeat-associated protein